MNKTLAIVSGVLVGIYSGAELLLVGMMAICGGVCTVGLQVLFLLTLGLGFLQIALYVVAIAKKINWLFIVLAVVPPILIVIIFFMTFVVT